MSRSAASSLEDIRGSREYFIISVATHHAMTASGLSRHGSDLKQNLVSIWCQFAPGVPVLPVMPVYKSLYFNKKGRRPFMAWKRSLGGSDCARGETAQIVKMRPGVGSNPDRSKGARTYFLDKGRQGHNLGPDLVQIFFLPCKLLVLLVREF